MALGKALNDPQLLDTLCELNDLVKALLGKDLSAAIIEIKEKTTTLKKAEDDLRNSKQAHAATVALLDEATAENDKSIIEVRKQREALTAEKQENTKQLAKIAAAQAAVDASRKEIEARISASTADLEVKSQAIAERERKVTARQAAVDSLRTEYEKKLDSLKKITG